MAASGQYNLKAGASLSLLNDSVHSTDDQVRVQSSIIVQPLQDEDGDIDDVEQNLSF